MRTTLPCIVFALLCCVGCGNSTPSEPDPDALDAAHAWLALIDNGDYEASWENAAPYFRRAVPKDDWVLTMERLRKPLCANVSREVMHTQYVTQIPGGPDGKYLVLQIQAGFENKQSAIETVTPMLTQDDTWRVSGYYIR